MILNLTGIARSSSPSPSPTPSTQTAAPAMNLTPISRFQGPAMNPAAAAVASPPPPPPPPPQKTVIPLQAVSRAIINQQSHPLTPDQLAAGHEATIAREAVYAANNVSGEDRLTGAVDPAIVAAADNAAQQASMHVAAAQASGQDAVSLDIDHTTGQVSLASFEDKVAAVPLWAKAAVAVGAVFGIGKLLSRKRG